MLLLLSSSTIAILTTVAPASASSTSLPANWPGSDGTYGTNINYSNQTAFNVSNVANGIQPNWVWPVPVNSIYADQGIEVAPIVEAGVIYLLSQSQVIFALNAVTGAVIWQKPLPVTYCPTPTNFNTCYVEDSHAGAGTIKGLPTGHYHDGSWAYTTSIYSQPLIWVYNNNYTIFAFNALTGTIVTKTSSYGGPTTVPGNYGLYDNVTPEMTIDQVNHIGLVGLSVTENVDAGRGAWMWFNFSTMPPKFISWTFLTPPGNTPAGWSLSSVQNMTNAWVFNGTGMVNLKALPAATLSTMLQNDWGTYGFNGSRSFAGASVGFGGPEAFNSKAKVMYIATSQDSPDTNSTYRPGPDLWASSVLALNETTRQPIWGVKTSAKDMYDWDCSWQVMLANITVSNVVHNAVMKSCKSGVVYAMDAATGAPLWQWSAVAGNVAHPTTTCEGPTSTDTSAPAATTTCNGSIKRSGLGGNVASQAQGQQSGNMPNPMFLNPLNVTQMTKENWPQWPLLLPAYNSGTEEESNPAYDPTTNMMFVMEYNAGSISLGSDTAPGLVAHPYTKPPAVTCPTSECTKNGTLSAVDVNTGNTIWSLNVNGLTDRGSVTVTNGVVMFPGLDGFMRFVNEQTGALIRSVNVGGPLGVPSVVAQDASGNAILLLTVGVPEEFAGSNPLGEVPGFVVEYNVTPGQVSTSTQTISNTVTVSGATSTTTVTTGSGGVVTTVTTTGSVSTVTNNSSSGVSSSTLYGVVGVAVILAITTGFFALRGRGKPAA
jgi:glucose dehydrogenase